MNKKLLMIISLVLCMALCLCACGGDTEPTDGTTEPSGATNPSTDPSTESTEPSDDGMKTYTITVKDSEGNPQAGVMVQICLESCMPGVTDANGVATFQQPEASGYSAGVMADYENTKVYYEDGKYDVTIVWDGAAAE